MYAERTETLAVMSEARNSYVDGHYVATLALAYADHVMNDALDALPAAQSRTQSDDDRRE